MKSRVTIELRDRRVVPPVQRLSSPLRDQPNRLHSPARPSGRGCCVQSASLALGAARGAMTRRPRPRASLFGSVMLRPACDPPEPPFNPTAPDPQPPGGLSDVAPFWAWRSRCLRAAARGRCFRRRTSARSSTATTRPATSTRRSSLRTSTAARNPTCAGASPRRSRDAGDNHKRPGAARARPQGPRRFSRRFRGFRRVALAQAPEFAIISCVRGRCLCHARLTGRSGQQSTLARDADA